MRNGFVGIMLLQHVLVYKYLIFHKIFERKRNWEYSPYSDLVMDWLIRD